MGRHGTGGSDNAHERGMGDEAAWSQDRIDSSPFWGSDDPPGWPAPPDQVEVTGQWRPAPERHPAEAAGSFTQGAEPYETTGAFAPPPAPHEPTPDDSGPFTAPQQPAPHDSGFFAAPQRAAQQDPGPFETTGAFTPPPDLFGDGPGDRRRPRDPEPFETTGAFTRPPFDEGIGSFDQPPSEPPAPGDVRVAGSPTQVNAPIPAWESGESTGFLGSGWSGSGSGYEELGEPEPRGRRGRRKRGPHDELDRAAAGGRGKVALLSVAAVAVVLGGTVAGVKMMSSSTTADQCPGAKCVAVQATNQPGPAVSSTAPAEDEEPTEEPTTDDPTTPAAVATTRAPVPRRTHAPTPTASPTKKARVKQSATPTREPTEDLQPTEEPTDDGLPTSSDQPSVVTTGEGTPIPSAQPTTSSIMGGSVNVGFDVSRRGLAGYTAKVHVANTSPQALSAATVSVPVTGKVLDVRGADWSQDGDLLIIDMPASLPSGESVDISFDAAGRASTPETCGLVGGDCTVN